MEKTVCHDCVGNRHLKKFISDKTSRGLCDYCGKNKYSVFLSDLVDEIIQCLSLEYSPADDVLGFDSSEGGYLGKTYATYDIVRDLFYEELGITNEQLLDDMINEINISSTYTWCEDGDWHYKDYDTQSLWARFSELVKYKVRYVYERIKVIDHDGVTETNILDEIGRYLQDPKLDLIKNINKGDLEIYRGRAHPCNKSMKCESDFYPPPRDKAVFGRMNPDGIPLFYGALDYHTVQDELYSEENNCLSIARFDNNIALTLLDITDLDLSRQPSIFDRNKQMLRNTYAFLSYFASEISKKIDHEYNIEYIPTQIFTEYLRHCFVINDKKVDGIIFPSSKKSKGKNVVLFIDSSNFNNQSTPLLRFIPDSIVLFEKKYRKAK
jgi:hypothetical protein